MLQAPKKAGGSWSAECGGIVEDEVRGHGNMVIWGLVDHGKGFGPYSM